MRFHRFLLEHSGMHSVLYWLRNGISVEQVPSSSCCPGLLCDVTVCGMAFEFASHMLFFHQLYDLLLRLPCQYLLHSCYFMSISTLDVGTKITISPCTDADVCSDPRCSHFMYSCVAILNRNRYGCPRAFKVCAVTAVHRSRRKAEKKCNRLTASGKNTSDLIVTRIVVARTSYFRPDFSSTR